MPSNLEVAQFTTIPSFSNIIILHSIRFRVKPRGKTEHSGSQLVANGLRNGCVVVQVAVDQAQLTDSPASEVGIKIKSHQRASFSKTPGIGNSQ